LLQGISHMTWHVSFPQNSNGHGMLSLLSNWYEKTFFIPLKRAEERSCFARRTFQNFYSVLSFFMYVGNSCFWRMEEVISDLTPQTFSSWFLPQWCV
jgi:hypothetical protein